MVLDFEFSPLLLPVSYGGAAYPEKAAKLELGHLKFFPQSPHFGGSDIRGRSGTAVRFFPGG